MVAAAAGAVGAGFSAAGVAGADAGAPDSFGSCETRSLMASFKLFSMFTWVNSADFVNGPAPLLPPIRPSIIRTI